MSVLKKNGLSHENKNSDEHIIPGGADSIEHALIQKLLTESSIGIFTYHFKDQSFKSSDSLRNLLSECLPDNTISAENLINNTVTEDKNFLVDLFTLPKPGRKKVSGQFRLIQKTRDYRETKIFQATAIYETDTSGDTILVCAIKESTRDIKQLKELQRNLEKSEESDRIKTNFLLNISHIIRTPMNSIMGFAELLNMTDPDPERRKEYVDVIKKQSKNLLQLIDDVAEIAKYESGNMTVSKSPVNINLLINEIVKDVENIRSSSRKEHVSISVDLPTREGIEIFTDAGRLHQVFVNIVNYSLKYTADGSIQIGYSISPDNRVECYVRDTSPGLSKDELRSLFDPFTLPSKNEQNRYDDETGLGLSLAKSIVKLLGGRLSADSEPGKGMIFNFSLPYEAVPKHAGKTIEEELFSAQYKWSDKVILIVEDEDVNGLFLEAVFQETGAQTLYAKNGHQAVELCKSISKIDLILMDIKMPVMNGLKATEEIRKFNQIIPIIAQTALSLEEDRQNCLLAGCNDLITKPIEVEELLALVNSYFHI